MFPVGCVTFGMPRVANSEFAIHFLTTLKKLKSPGFAYGRDPVPHVPPRFFGFRSTQYALYHTLQHYLLTSGTIFTLRKCTGTQMALFMAIRHSLGPPLR